MAHYSCPWPMAMWQHETKGRGFKWGWRPVKKIGI